MNKYVAFLFIILLSISCSDEQDYEIVSSEEVLPQSQGKYDYVEDLMVNAEEELSPTQEELLAHFPEVYFVQENVLKDRKMLFIPDRLGYNEKNETYFIKDSIPFHFIEWTFQDSLKTVNAFYNWLDCFGPDCRSLRIDDEINASKEAFVIWVSNTKISYIASNKSINRRVWQEAFFRQQKNTWNYIIHQAPRGKMTWHVSATKNKEK